MTDPIPFYCGVCKYALDRLDGPDGTTYIHPRSQRLPGVAEHDPAPVRLADLPDAKMLCDFCGETAQWVHTLAALTRRQSVVTAATVGLSDYQNRSGAARVLRVDTEPATPQRLGSIWAACGACSTLVQAGDVLGLMARAVEGLPAKMRRPNRLAEVRGQLRQTYEGLFAELGPDRAPIDTFRANPGGST
jgi:hypothetical protein